MWPSPQGLPAVRATRNVNTRQAATLEELGHLNMDSSGSLSLEVATLDSSGGEMEPEASSDWQHPCDTGPCPHRVG